MVCGRAARELNLVVDLVGSRLVKRDCTVEVQPALSNISGHR
jgi:hypothetical protein